MAARRPKKMGEWREQAVCVNKPPKWFFPERSQTDAAKGKCVCRICPVRDECLDEAIANGERFGIWGGMDTQERVKEARRRRKAAAE